MIVILQLGMMVIAVGLSSYNVALFHLVNHAFYKALLFLGAGAVIHAVSDNQDQHNIFIGLILSNSGQFLKLKLQRVRR